ncbi:glycosyltransferase family 4 protein [Pontimicrobium aquaticum]|uniref:glycosyltransferase family 4 protein n=1 Tax=Pontimicrobium aquaticum TaxID=2565367 RepID=UPI00145DF73E|nr:glycosyltransferase family 4 protein [Pontimicrobium aquaticum]
MPKLLYITTNLQGSGGVARVLSVKLNYLIERYGYTIHVVTTNNTSETFFYEFNKRIVFHKIDIKNFGFRYLFKYKTLLQNIIDNVQPNIIINCDNGFKGNLLPYIVKTKTPLVYERHGSRKIDVNTLKERIKNKIANIILDNNVKNYQAFIILNNEDTKDWKANNIKVIPNPLCLKLPFEQSELKNKIALAVGRHSVEKQFDILLKVWKKVVENYPDWTLKIYGESDKEYALKRLIEKLNINNQVQLYPPTKNITEEYSKVSMLLNTSSSEAFGLVILEAMAFGLPTIAFDSASGPKQLINDGENSFLINSFDMDAYANKIKLLIKDEELRNTLGDNAKQIAEKFNLDKIMKQWHELFQSLSS